MKRYKLRKDTPAFKAGTECYIEEAGHMVPCRGISYTIVHKDQLEKNPSILTDWFEEIKEPLIKDAGARDVMRLWAKVNRIPTNATTIEYHFVESLCGTESEFWDNNLHIMFYGKIAPNAVHGKIYTITELCGEEEE